VTPRVVWSILAALPGVILAAVGLTHPHDLDPTTAGHWIMMHVGLVPIFPLLGLALFIPAWRFPRWSKIVLGVLVFLYAVYYGALDAVAGIGAGIAVQRSQARGDIDRWMFQVGNGSAGPAPLPSWPPPCWWRRSRFCWSGAGRCCPG
jgi:hypothetical protein